MSRSRSDWKNQSNRVFACVGLRSSFWFYCGVNLLCRRRTAANLQFMSSTPSRICLSDLLCSFLVSDLSRTPPFIFGILSNNAVNGYSSVFFSTRILSGTENSQTTIRVLKFQMVRLNSYSFPFIHFPLPVNTHFFIFKTTQNYLCERIIYHFKLVFLKIKFWNKKINTTDFSSSLTWV